MNTPEEVEEALRESDIEKLALEKYTGARKIKSKESMIVLAHEVRAQKSTREIGELLGVSHNTVGSMHTFRQNSGQSKGARV